MPETSVAIVRLSPAEVEARLDELATLLRLCVEGGASVNFVLPFGQDEARAFWTRRVLPPLREGTRIVLAALVEGRVAGSVQLATETPPNQPHRADVTKLLVHPDHRRRGIGRRLMGELEAVAHEKGRTLLTLDTTTGDRAEPLYASLGFVTVGVIPGYSLDTTGSRLEPTTVMYKAL